jgi:hypothetical protein
MTLHQVTTTPAEKKWGRNDEPPATARRLEPLEQGGWHLTSPPASFSAQYVYGKLGFVQPQLQSLLWDPRSRRLFAHNGTRWYSSTPGELTPSESLQAGDYRRYFR